MNTKSTKALTFCALCVALGVVILALGLILPGQRLALLCLSSLGVLASLCRWGHRWALACYASTAFLSLLLLPEKSLALVYALFCGYYPAVKLKLEAIASRFGRFAAKLICFDLALCVFLYLIKLPTQLPVWLLFAGANGAFMLYDYALTKLILLYTRKIAGRIEHG